MVPENLKVQTLWAFRNFSLLQNIEKLEGAVWPNRSAFTELVRIGPYLVRICSASLYSYGPGRNLLY